MTVRLGRAPWASYPIGDTLESMSPAKAGWAGRDGAIVGPSRCVLGLLPWESVPACSKHSHARLAHQTPRIPCRGLL